jgi:hypothetical protein
MAAHWGGPVKYIDTSRATPRIVLTASERDAIIKHLDNRVSQEDIVNLFQFLEIREIVDIDFDDII